MQLKMESCHVVIEKLSNTNPISVRVSFLDRKRIFLPFLFVYNLCFERERGLFQSDLVLQHISLFTSTIIRFIHFVLGSNCTKF